MDLKEIKSLEFVVRHYRKGRLDTRKAYRKFLREHAPQMPKPVLWRRYAAAVLVLAFLSGALYYWMQPAEKWTVVRAGNEIKEILLPDSSRVTLAPGSSVRYEASAFVDRRRVEMEGKAFFQVVRDPRFPFSVRNRQAEVCVLGTEFQVSGRGDTTEVWVQSGKVSFASLENKEKLILTQGMRAVLAGHNERPRPAESAAPNVTVWKTGYFVYDDTPLETVLEELSAYYGVKLSAPPASFRLTARFPAGDLDETIEVIETTLGIKIEKDFN